MDRPSSDNKPLFFITAVFVLLLGSSFLSRKIKFAPVKKIDFLSDVFRTVPAHPAPGLAGATAAKDTFYRDYHTFNGITTYEPGTPYALHRFLAALDALKSGRRKKVRVAYFGDSMIEGDLISGDFRQLLQEAFGGEGVGFVPVTSISASFRQTVGHSFSDDWTDRHFRNAKRDRRLFLSGHYFLPGAASSVTYKPRGSEFEQVRLLYGPGPEALSVQVNGVERYLAGEEVCNEVLLDTACPAVHARFRGGRPVYGFSFEGDSGVYVDNFSFRGISGTELGRLDSTLLQSLARCRPYDLVIFQYGPNLLCQPGLQEFGFYRKPMEAVVKKFEAAFPGASILLVSTADKSFRYGHKMETALGVEPLIDVQNEVARSGHANLWNLYRAMGGRNAMVQWAEGDTVLANKDYTHLNWRGAKRVGTLLFGAIMQEWELSRKQLAMGNLQLGN